jgi:uncharacterized protein with PIN domain
LRSRIEEGYRRRFRELLALVRPRRLDFGVELLVRRGRERSQREGLPLVRGLAAVYEETRRRVQRRVGLTGACSVVKPPWERFDAADPPRFLCDACLGGLARWLRAAGYEAGTAEATDDGAMVEEARSEGRVLLTSDSEVMDRRLIRDGTVVALWMPTGLSLREQLGIVLRDLGLGLRAPRCMACGGELRAVEKDAVQPRIPPRTARWKDEYFVCGACDQLFWQGTHWQRISSALAEAVGG